MIGTPPYMYALIRLTTGQTISCKTTVKPAARSAFPKYIENIGWVYDGGYFVGVDTGYSFKQLLCDVYHCLGDDLARLQGMQQLIQHYHLCNCGNGAPEIAASIKRLLKTSQDA